MMDDMTGSMDCVAVFLHEGANVGRWKDFEHRFGGPAQSHALWRLDDGPIDQKRMLHHKIDQIVESPAGTERAGDRRRARQRASAKRCADPNRAPAPADAGAERIIGTKRLYADGKFSSKDGKATFMETKWRGLQAPGKEAESKKWPFLINNGRTNHVWQNA